MHAHPTLSEVLDELFKGAHLEKAQPSKVGLPALCRLTLNKLMFFSQQLTL